VLHLEITHISKRLQAGGVHKRGGHWGLSETEKPAKVFTKTEKPEEKSLKTQKNAEN